MWSDRCQAYVKKCNVNCLAIPLERIRVPSYSVTSSISWVDLPENTDNDYDSNEIYHKRCALNMLNGVTKHKVRVM